MLPRRALLAAARAAPSASPSPSHVVSATSAIPGGRAALMAPRWAAAGRRCLSSGDGQSAESAERQERMVSLLKEKLQTTHLVVQDISGGCGAMYNVEVESPLFQGKNLMAQHRMVNEVLAKEIKEMHGLSLKTRAPKS